MKRRPRWLRYGWDHLSAYLPALLMALFALGTWWLVRSVPNTPGSGADRPVRHEPDYTMRQFSVKSFTPAGTLKSEIIGAEGHHYPDNDTLEVTLPRLRSFSDEGHLTVATAQRGVSSGDGDDIQLFGNAHVVREVITRPDGSKVPRLEFRGEYLRALVKADQVMSDKPVELTRGTDRFTGDTFEYDHKNGVAVLTGRVRGVIEPRS